jgi:hypothetical protein
LDYDPGNYVIDALKERKYAIGPLINEFQRVAKILSVLKNKDWVFLLSISAKKNYDWHL